ERGLDPFPGQLGEGPFDLTPDTAQRDPEHSLPALKQIDHLVGGGALVDAHAVAHQRDPREVLDPSVTQMLYGGADLLERDAGVEKPLDDLQNQDVAEAVEPLGSGAVSRPDPRFDELGTGPVVELPVGDPGSRARDRPAVADVGGQRHRPLLEEQTLLASAPTGALTPPRIIPAGRLSLAAADRHCGPPAFSHPT